MVSIHPSIQTFYAVIINMFLEFHQVKDNKPVLLNSKYIIFVEQYPKYLEIVALTDECFQVKETYEDFIQMINKGKQIDIGTDVIDRHKKVPEAITGDAISKDIKKKKFVSKHHRYRKSNQVILEKK